MNERPTIPLLMNGRVRVPSLTLGLMAALLVLATSLACRLEIGSGRAVSAQSQAPNAGAASIMSAETSSGGQPLSTPAAGASSAVDAAAAGPLTAPTTPVSLTPAPTATATRPPTATPTPVLPALAPPDRIRAEAIKLDAPVTTVGWTIVERDGQRESVWVVPDDVAGWHQNSAMPGNGGNVILSGHHNMGSEVFRYLVDLKAGDEVVLHADGRDYTYVVSDRFILPDRNVPMEQRLQNAQWIQPTEMERLTLVTCWPYNDNSHRVIIIANPLGG